MYQDGFLIESVWDDEEPLFVSREEEVVMPDYSGARAKCCICGASFQDIVDTVLHVHEAHGVLGGPQIVMLGECWQAPGPVVPRPQLSSFRR